jgi:hypothetical protein
MSKKNPRDIIVNRIRYCRLVAQCLNQLHHRMDLKTKMYRNIILSTVLYGFENWSLTLRKELRMRVFENKLPRRTFGPKMDEITREWRKPHNKELSDLYSSPNTFRLVKSRRMRWAEQGAQRGRGEVCSGCGGEP